MADAALSKLLQPSRCEGAISELIRAHSYTQQSGGCAWQFAVEIWNLSGHGLSSADLRLLIEKGFLLHARETTDDDATERQFDAHGSQRFSTRSCFCLTDEGSRALEGLGVPIEMEAIHDRIDKTRPEWKIGKRELSFGGLPVKRFRCPAINQETVLAAFEEEGWPEKILDPLPRLNGSDPKKRLHDTTKSLNRNQLNRCLRFCGDGTGEGIIWEPIDR